MTRLGFVGAVALAITTGSIASAQSAGIPAEFPPSSFDGNQFVDSAGCAFIRAGNGGVTNWVPRVDRRRNQLCNFQPTFAAGTPAGPAPAPVTTTARVAPLDAPVIEITAPAPEARGTSLRGIFGGGEGRAPIETVASTPAPVTIETPTVAAPAPVIAPTPRVVQAPAAPVVAPPAPRLTRADVCEGRFGVQPGFISDRTGDPIDCGPAPQVAAAPAPVIDVPAPAATPEPRRITLAQACAEIGTTGFRYISAQTGQPIVCPDAAPAQTTMIAGTATNAAPTAPQGPAAPAAAVVPTTPDRVAVTTACANIPTVDGLAVRCGPQQISPHGQPTGPISRQQTAETRGAAATALFQRETPVPASNPVVTRREVIRPPSGYQRVWGDGRLNAHRGLPAAPAAAPATAAKAPAPVAVTQERVSTRSAPASVAASHRYIQVGTFGDHANADRLIQRLGAAGLPVGAGRSGAMKIVAVGPFRSQADLQRALQTVRGMGFGDAYPRN